MKLYVDSKDYVITYCAFNGRESLETKNTPIIVENIADHDKQIRKEVVQEIREMLKGDIINSFGIFNVDYSKQYVDKILDQVENGGINEKIN